MKKTILSTALIILASINILAQTETPSLTISNDNINISTSNGKALYNGNELATKNDLSQTDVNLQRGATLVIAASNASERSKAGADLICTGVDDQNTINQAIWSLTETGGLIQLTEGTFNIHNQILLCDTRGDITFQGTGMGTVLKRKFLFPQGSDCLIRLSHQNYVILRNLQIDSDNMTSTYSNNTEIFFYTDATSREKGFALIENINFVNGLIHGNGADNTIAIAILGIDSVIKNCGINGKYYSQSINISSQSTGYVKTLIDGCYCESRISVINTRAIITNNESKTLLSNTSLGSIISNNHILEELAIYGSNVIITGNIYRTIYNHGGSNVLETNNIQM